ncbi:MAG: hypothetical protein ACI38U_03235 [Corynebacterium sp.]|uniref:hypothetical protein n=1 Tax=Corynebacterium sp. TaxID=1720 RepID=UPI003F0902BE
MKIKVTKYVIDVVPDTERWMTMSDYKEWADDASEDMPIGFMAKAERDSAGNITRINASIPRGKRDIHRRLRDAMSDIRSYSDVTISVVEDLVERTDYEDIFGERLPENEIVLESE